MKKGVRKAVDWYEQNKPTYDDLVANTRELLRSLLSANSISFVDVQGRSKSVKSFTDKINKKPYQDPSVDVTDLAGLRVIVLIESDISRAKDVISDAFRVHDNDSIDKSEALGADRVGYRSLHLICDLGDARLNLPEFKRFANCKFEIQIRTALQHAWAEIEHDRGYKLRGTLPSHLKRKFSLLAGLLELADTQFDELSQAVQQYAAEVAKKAGSGDLSIELNSSSVRELLSIRLGADLQDPADPSIWTKLIEELQNFGIENLRELDALMTPEVRAMMLNSNPEGALPGVVRDVMLFNDLDQYFDKAWNGNWGALDRDSYDALCAHYGDEKVDNILDAHEIEREWEWEPDHLEVGDL
ncbi:hypothetical protein QF205_12835 [Luteimonas composti]|uniref:RelA/SpoT domain-containing protein n=1 Tax=Luteimonas composti TaxID=398257 RepID=A0ABT6MTL7_9GAMM|nr:hypothetical protein [Luteimonas composti]MDH7453945.1 hypothetical protein [Luteimonas composti]